MQSFLLLLPDFALIALGVLLRRFFGLGDGFWPGVERLVYFVFFPALLFNALARASIDLVAMAPLLAVGLLCMAAGLLLALAGRPLLGLDAMGFASRAQCAYRFNTYIGIAVAGKFAGAPGLAMMGALCGAMVPFANMAAVGMMARHGQGRLLQELLRNPLIIATVAGLAFNLSGARLPEPVLPFMQRLADAAVTLGLLAVGRRCAAVVRRAAASARFTCAWSSCSRCRRSRSQAPALPATSSPHVAGAPRAPPLVPTSSGFSPSTAAAPAPPSTSRTASPTSSGSPPQASSSSGTR